MEFSLMRILTLVSNFFISIMNQVFSIEFFHNFAFGKIALVVLSVCLAFDVFLQIFGRQIIDGGRATGDISPCAGRVRETYSETVKTDSKGRTTRWQQHSVSRSRRPRKR